MDNDIDLKLAEKLFKNIHNKKSQSEYDNYIDQFYFRQRREDGWKHRKNLEEYSVLTDNNIRYKERQEAKMVNNLNNNESVCDIMKRLKDRK